MDEQDIEFLICDISVLWRRAFSLHTKEMGISTIERRIILNVDRRPGATQVEIANLIDIEPQNLTKPLDRLIASKLCFIALIFFNSAFLSFSLMPAITIGRRSSAIRHIFLIIGIQF